MCKAKVEGASEAQTFTQAPNHSDATRLVEFSAIWRGKLAGDYGK
jgi:hypothetical protein